MSNNKIIYFMSFFLMVDLAAAAPKKDPGFNRGFLPTVFVGLRALTHRLRARTTPQEDMRTILEAMQTLLGRMQTMTLPEVEQALVQMRDFQRQYLDFVREYRVSEAALMTREAGEFLCQAEALVTRLRQPVATPRRITPRLDGVSPTAVRLSERFEELIGQTPEPVVRELRPLVQRLLEVQERDAQRVQAQIETLLERLSQTDLVGEEVMTIRGAVQQILRQFRIPAAPHANNVVRSVTNDGAPLGLDSDDEHENDGAPLGLESDEE